jgi:hypothetical protein
MSKRQRKVWSRVGIISNLGLLGISVTTSLVQLRANNVEMIKLYKAVEVADVSGIQTYDKLKQLQLHVAGHMNATPPKLGTNPGIQLKNTYERAKKYESEKATTERTRIYNEAIDYCEAALPSSLLSDRAQCIIDRSASQAVIEKTVVADLYRHDFVSPRWSADVAGWSVLTSLVLIVTFLAQVAARFISRYLTQA